MCCTVHLWKMMPHTLFWLIQTFCKSYLNIYSFLYHSTCLCVLCILTDPFDTEDKSSVQIHGFHHSNNTGPHDRDICPCSCYNSSLFIRFRASESIQKLCSIDFASGVSNPQRVLTMQMFSDLGRASGAEQEYLLLKAKVEHGWVWSPNGWVAVMC